MAWELFVSRVDENDDDGNGDDNSNNGDDVDNECVTAINDRNLFICCILYNYNDEKIKQFMRGLYWCVRNTHNKKTSTKNN